MFHNSIGRYKVFYHLGNKKDTTPPPQNVLQDLMFLKDHQFQCLHSHLTYKYFLCLTTVVFDLSVYTTVLVTLRTCELQKLIHSKVLEFANSLTQYLQSMQRCI